MAKRAYRLDFLIDSSQAESGARRVTAGLKQAEVAAHRAGAAIQKAFGAQAAAAESASARATASAQKSAQAQVAATALAARAQERAATQGMVGLDALRLKAFRFADAQAAGAERARKAQEKAATQGMIGLDQLRMKAVRFADAQRAGAERAAAAARASAESQVIGIDQLRASGLKMQDQLRAAGERRARAEDRLRTKALTEEQVAQKVRNRMVSDHNKHRVEQAMRAAGLEQRTFGQILSGHKGVLAGIGASVVAMRLLTSLGQAYAQAMKEAGDESRRMAEKFGQGRDELGELASIMDVPLDNKFTLDFAKFNVRTGLKADESKRFQTSFYGGAAQHIGEGKHISAEQGLKFKEMAGRFAVANRIDPEVIGDFAGQILASKDFSKDGEMAAENALTELNTTFKIASRGRGSNPVLLQQFVKSAATMLREDAAQGIMRGPQEVMKMISVQAERNPEDAETFARRGTQGLRAFGDKKAGPLLKRAGITAADRPFEAAGKLMPVVRAEAQKRGPGFTDVDILGEYFDEREAGGIATMFRGIESGAVADREKYAAQFDRPGVARKALDTYSQSEAGRKREANAQVELAEAERGAENSKLDILRTQAKAHMIKNKLIDTSNVKMKQWVMGKATFGMLDYSDQALIDLYASRTLNERIPGTQMDMPSLPNNPERREAMFRRHIGFAEAMNVDPLSGMRIALEQNTAEVKKNNALMEKQVAVPGGAPGRLPIAPPAPAPLPPAP